MLLLTQIAKLLWILILILVCSRPTTYTTTYTTADNGDNDNKPRNNGESEGTVRVLCLRQSQRQTLAFAQFTQWVSQCPVVCLSSYPPHVLR